MGSFACLFLYFLVFVSHTRVSTTHSTRRTVLVTRLGGYRSLGCGAARHPHLPSVTMSQYAPLGSQYRSPELGLINQGLSPRHSQWRRLPQHISHNRSPGSKSSKQMSHVSTALAAAAALTAAARSVAATSSSFAFTFAASSSAAAALAATSSVLAAATSSSSSATAAVSAAAAAAATPQVINTMPNKGEDEGEDEREGEA